MATMRICSRIRQSAPNSSWHRLKSRKPDLIAIAGDIWDRAVILGSPATIAAIRFVQAMGSVAPVIIASGTLTHDAPGSTRIFGELRTVYPVYATETPCQIALTRERFYSHCPRCFRGQPQGLSSDNLCASDGDEGMHPRGERPSGRRGEQGDRGACARPSPGMGHAQREGEQSLRSDHVRRPLQRDRGDALDGSKAHRAGDRDRRRRLAARQARLIVSGISTRPKDWAATFSTPDRSPARTTRKRKRRAFSCTPSTANASIRSS